MSFFFPKWKRLSNVCLKYRLTTQNQIITNYKTTNYWSATGVVPTAIIIAVERASANANYIVNTERFTAFSVALCPQRMCKVNATNTSIFTTVTAAY